CHRRIRRSRVNNHRSTRADLYPFSCVRKARLVVLGLAQGLSGIQLLQGDRCRNLEYSLSSADTVFCRPRTESGRPANDDRCVSISDYLGGYNRIPPHQNPRHGTRAIQWRYWWTRWRLWRGNHGDSGRDVITLVETRNEASRERRKDGRRDESHP